MKKIPKLTPLAANFVRVDVGRMTYWFSYETLVAFAVGDDNQVLSPRFVRQNMWGTSTGRHLNQIDGGPSAHRLSESDFLASLNRALRA